MRAVVSDTLLSPRDNQTRCRHKYRRKLTHGFRVCTHEPDLFRTIEYSYAYDRMRRSKASRWIDVGCGDTPFSAFALSTNAARACALVDVDADALEAQARNMSAASVSPKRFRLIKEDLRDERILPNFSANVDGALVVSTIEHMQGDADVRFMERLWELLPQNAPVIVTVPALDSYEENHAGHYHGSFERRYDLRAFLARLQVSGFAVDDLRFIAHRNGRAHRLAEETLPSADAFFARWYDQEISLHARRLLQPLLADALLNVTTVPSRGAIGIMATFRRTDKTVRDSVRDFAGQTPRIDLPAPAEPPTGIALQCPVTHIVQKRTERVVIPLIMTNTGDKTVEALPIGPGNMHVGVHMTSVLSDDTVWDYCHTPLPRDIPARSTVLVPVTIEAPMDLCDFEFVIDLVKEGHWWQGDVAMKPARARVTFTDEDV